MTRPAATWPPAWRSRRRGQGWPCRVQLLVYPATDARRRTRSAELFATGFYLTRAYMDLADESYAASDADLDDPRYSPLRADVPPGLAPALVFTAGFDPLRDEGEEYARRLADAGVPVELTRFPDQIHGFVNIVGVGRSSVAANRGRGRRRCARRWPQVDRWLTTLDRHGESGRRPTRPAGLGLGGGPGDPGGRGPDGRPGRPGRACDGPTRRRDADRCGAVVRTRPDSRSRRRRRRRAAPTRGSERAAPTRALFFGDSYFIGGGYTGERNSMARLAGDRLGWVSEVNGGGGTGFVQTNYEYGLGNYLDQIAEGAFDVGPRRWVVIEGGNNDVGEPLDDVRANARRVVRIAQRTFPNATVVLVGPLDTDGDHSELVPIIKALRRVAAKRAVPVRQHEELAGRPLRPDRAGLRRTPTPRVTASCGRKLRPRRLARAPDASAGLPLADLCQAVRTAGTKLGTVSHKAGRARARAAGPAGPASSSASRAASCSAAARAAMASAAARSASTRPSIAALSRCSYSSAVTCRLPSASAVRHSAVARSRPARTAAWVCAVASCSASVRACWAARGGLLGLGAGGLGLAGGLRLDGARLLGRDPGLVRPLGELGLLDGDLVRCLLGLGGPGGRGELLGRTPLGLLAQPRGVLGRG